MLAPIKFKSTALVVSEMHGEKFFFARVSPFKALPNISEFRSTRVRHCSAEIIVSHPDIMLCMIIHFIGRKQRRIEAHRPMYLSAASKTAGTRAVMQGNGRRRVAPTLPKTHGNYVSRHTDFRPRSRCLRQR